MKRRFPTEFVFQVFALIVAIIIVHAFYVSVVRPNAIEDLREQQIQLAENPDAVVERSAWVIIKDFEQEACFILMLWAMAIMGYKGLRLSRERALHEVELIPVAEGLRILPEDTREYARQIQALPEPLREYLLPRALLTGLHRFESTRNIQDVAAAGDAVFEEEAERLESELSMIRYIAWAIPSIGFIGTVRGIGDALSQAHQAIEGNIMGVTQSLGTAFNSTFIALLISIVIMFLVHQIQLYQERLVLESKEYADRHLVRQLQVR
jgi:biopolymer transport protein ExbB/TolQ